MGNLKALGRLGGLLGRLWSPCVYKLVGDRDPEAECRASRAGSGVLLFFVPDARRCRGGRGEAPSSQQVFFSSVEHAFRVAGGSAARPPSYQQVVFASVEHAFHVAGGAAARPPSSQQAF